MITLKVDLTIDKNFITESLKYHNVEATEENINKVCEYFAKEDMSNYDLETLNKSGIDSWKEVVLDKVITKSIK